MICGASIAKRDGSHRPCLLRDQHEGDCSPFAVLELAPPARGEVATIAGVHVLFAIIVILVCCLAGCDVDADQDGRKVLVGCVCFAVGWALAVFTRRRP